MTGGSSDAAQIGGSRLSAPRPSVLVTRRLPEAVRAELARLFDLEAHDSDEPLGRDELLHAVAGRAGLLTLLSDRVDGELLDAAGPGLRVVANYAVGYENIDVGEATRRGVVVTNTPDVLTAATAELTLALMLGVMRRVAEGDRLVRSRRPWRWSLGFMLATGLAGRTLGIVGLGRIGGEVAQLGEAFGMRVVYTTRSPRGGVTHEWLPLDDLLARADVVSIHCPLTPETRHLIDAAALARMKPTAFLVNTARGAIVDEAALVAALRAGRIAGAGLDVYEREPEVSEGLLDLDNVVLTPHVGSATRETREAMGMLCVEGLQAVLLEGRAPANALNPEALR